MSTEAHTPDGSLRGLRDGDVVRYRGIRYATGERFRPPVDEPAWDGIRDALVDGPMCPQPLFVMDLLGLPDATTPQSEDCFFITVTVPATPTDRPRAVMVWFYGGSYVNGSGSSDVYDPARLVVDGDVIVVTVNYRLGAFGYLGLDGTAEANLGVLDQLSGLRWVQRNIAGFGGDPGKVTVFGQSAGADSVSYLLAIDEAEGLFHRAILQSAPLGLDKGRVAIARQLTANFTARLPHAQSATVDQILEAQTAAMARLRGNRLTAGMPYAPVPGVWPVPPADELPRRWAARAASVDVIIGFARDDASPFLERVAAIARLPQRVQARLVDALTRRIFGDPALRLARVLAEAGARVFTYRFDWRPKGTPWGACHCIDLPFFWGDERAWAGSPMLGGADWADVDAYGVALRAAWAEFARTGNAGWAPITRGRAVGKRFDFTPRYTHDLPKAAEAA